MESNGKKINLNNIAVWVAILSILSGFAFGIGKMSEFAIQLNNIGVVDTRLSKKIQVINEMHNDMDKIKVDILTKYYELKLEIKEEEIKRLKYQLEKTK